MEPLLSGLHAPVGEDESRTRAGRKERPEESREGRRKRTHLMGMQTIKIDVGRPPSGSSALGRLNPSGLGEHLLGGEEQRLWVRSEELGSSSTTRLCPLFRWGPASYQPGGAVTAGPLGISGQTRGPASGAAAPRGVFTV